MREVWWSCDGSPEATSRGPRDARLFGPPLVLQVQILFKRATKDGSSLLDFSAFKSIPRMGQSGQKKVRGAGCWERADGVGKVDRGREGRRPARKARG